MAAAPLMPKATAVWLVENTALSFDQVAEFCKLHPLEVKAIADGDAAQGIKGLDPDPHRPTERARRSPKAEADPGLPAQAARAQGAPAPSQEEEGPALHAGVAPPGPAQRHPVAGAQSSELKDSQIMRLVGTTKSTIQAIRERTHWNASNLQPMDPVTLGLCSQIDLDLEVHRAAKEKPADRRGPGRDPAAGLRDHRAARARAEEPKKSPDELDVDAVFAKLKQIGGEGGVAPNIYWSVKIIAPL